MRTILTILSLLICSTSFAQDSRLFENIWYLNNLIIAGTHNIPPTNDEIPFVRAEFIEPNVIYTGMCESTGRGEIIYNGNSEFTFQDLAVLGGGCYQNNPFNEDFNNLYIRIYLSATSKNVYTYIITEDGNNRTLTIINSNGDKAIYGNEFLSINDSKNEAFSIFPNPVEDVICIQKKKNVNLSKIMIFDLNGRLIQLNDQIDSDNPTINVQKLNKGIYFISLENETNQIIHAKFIKK